jgi:nucleoside-diphosphate-sugar epimerase
VRILVAGGAGFVGSHLCEALLDRGDEVIAVDNFLTGSRSNVGHLLDRALPARRARWNPAARLQDRWRPPHDGK